MTATAGQVLEQSFQPFRPEKFSIPISNRSALNIYSSTKPSNLKIANLQKGLIFVHDGVERVGEGTGFGFPVLIYPKETFFSGSAEVWVKQTRGSLKIRKDFVMDRIARNKLGNVHLENQQARGLIKVLTDLYQKKRRFRYLALKELIVNMGVQSTFVKTAPIGKVPVTYTVSDRKIKVEVDFRHLLKKGLKKIFVLNEQSASFFARYKDSNGANLVGKQMGAWDTVNAESACLTDLQGRIGYRLWNVEDCSLRRGREIMKNCLDWSGLDYEVNPRKKFLKYRIEVFGGEP